MPASLTNAHQLGRAPISVAIAAVLDIPGNYGLTFRNSCTLVGLDHT